MTKAIVLAYDPFVMESMITIVNDDGAKSYNVATNMAEAAKLIDKFSREYGISTVKIHAPEHIIQQIHEIINSNYSDNNITIEEI